MREPRRRLIENALWVGAIVSTLTAIATWNNACERTFPLALTAFVAGILTIAATLASARGGGDRRRAGLIVLGVGAGVALFLVFFSHWVDSCTA